MSTDKPWPDVQDIQMWIYRLALVPEIISPHAETCEPIMLDGEGGISAALQQHILELLRDSPEISDKIRTALVEELGRLSRIQKSDDLLHETELLNNKLDELDKLKWTKDPATGDWYTNREIEDAKKALRDDAGLTGNALRQRNWRISRGWRKAP
jgi:hypothetical protein